MADDLSKWHDVIKAQADKAALTRPAPSPRDVEAVAQMIHDAPSYYAGDDEKRPWVPHGNSMRQVEARALALDIFARMSGAAVPEWRDIKTDPPPKDGTPIDVYTGNAEFPQRQCDISWREPTDSEFWTHGSDEPNPKEGTISADPGWFDCLGWKLQGENEPTHWMPVPAAPEVPRDPKKPEEV